MNERKKQNREELFKLMRENPDLPVVPMVACEIVGDDYGLWLGSWGSSCVDEYFWSEWAERYFFKSDNDVFDTLEKHLSGEEFESLPETEEECRPIYDALPWTKAIIVYIDLPE